MGKYLSRRSWLVRCCTPFAVVLATGCATGVGGAASDAHPGAGADQAALMQRANAYWAAVQKNDRVLAWSFEEVSKDPAWTLEGYLKRGGIVYDAYEVRGVKSIEGGKAEVDVWMRYSVPLLRLKGQEAVTQDEWRLIDGTWHHVLKKSAMFPSVAR